MNRAVHWQKIVIDHLDLLGRIIISEVVPIELCFKKELHRISCWSCRGSCNRNVLKKADRHCQSALIPTMSACCMALKSWRLKKEVNCLNEASYKKEGNVKKIILPKLIIISLIISLIVIISLFCPCFASILLPWILQALFCQYVVCEQRKVLVVACWF